MVPNGMLSEELNDIKLVIIDWQCVVKLIEKFVIDESVFREFFTLADNNS